MISVVSVDLSHKELDIFVKRIYIVDKACSRHPGIMPDREFDTGFFFSKVV